MQALWEEKFESAEAAEVHWSTGTILATFFAASLISAVFFGLGYSFGRGGTVKPAVGMASSVTGVAAAVIGHSTPSPVPLPDQSRQRPISAMGNSATLPGNASAKRMRVASEQTSRIQTRHATIIPAKANKLAATTPHPKAPVAKAGVAHYMVQVGAVGDRKDARMLVSQLRKHGFHAEIYSGKHDKYLHVQIGPFANADQAQTMRHHVMANGYHAILKHSS